MLTKEPLVSTRISIAWPPLPPSENTSTLVLTGRSGYYLDLRLFLAGPQKGEIEWASVGRKTFITTSPGGNDAFT